MRVSFALVVWGEDYVKDFLDASLPTLLAEGNLADTVGLAGSRFHLLTTPADRDLLYASALFERLKSILPVDFIDISQIRGSDKYNIASRCQLEAIRLSEDFDALVLLYPDVIWSRGSIRFAVNALESGALAVFSPAPAIQSERTLAELNDLKNPCEPAGARAISITPDQVTDLVLRNFHPMWDAFDWNGDCFTDSPACLRWNVGNQGWLIRCFHLHPVILRVQRDNPRYFSGFNVSLDGEYVARLFDGTSHLCFATDSRKFAIASLRAVDSPPLPRHGRRSEIASVSRWAEAHTLLLHRAFAKVAFRWQRGPLDDAAWHTATTSSANVISEVIDRLNTPDSIIKLEDLAAYRARMQRKHMLTARRSTIVVPPSRAGQSRMELATLLVARVTKGAIWRAASTIRNSRFANWLAYSPTATRLWKRTKSMIQPQSTFDDARSNRDIIRSIVRGRLDRND